MGFNFDTTLEMKAIKEKDINQYSYTYMMKNEIANEVTTVLDDDLTGTFKITKKSKLYFFSKRCIDIVASLMGIIVLLPLFLVIGLVIKLTDFGPVFFVQNRVGLNGKTFRMIKFRSMRVNAEDELKKLLDKNEAEGPLFKIKDDPRITKFGKFIRKTSIDELPQLFNILMGSMTIVGPRPPLPSEVEQYNEYQMNRLKVKPGLTCYWQCSGRSNLGFDQMVDLDLKYINERSLFVDIKIILMTIPAVLFNKGAF